MRELLEGLERWVAEGHRVALARVVRVDGSAPRPVGATMAVNEAGEVLGSVSAGCVEPAVVVAALEVLDGAPAHLRRFGYDDADALAAGLTCGGSVQIAVGPMMAADVQRAWSRHLRAGTPLALATVVEGPGAGATLLVDADAAVHAGSLGHPALEHRVARDAAGELTHGDARLHRYGGDERRGGRRETGDGGTAVAVLVQPFRPPARMIVVGAVDVAAALTRLAPVLGFRTTVVDARAVFATRARFPAADELVVEPPHRLLGRIGAGLTPRDVVCVLTHEARFDVPAIVAALGTDAGYIGAMGSRRTHADRVRRLREAGVDDAGLARLRSPIGLDLGARTPEEIAVSICAEVVAVRNRVVPAVIPLSTTRGPLHRRDPQERVAGVPTVPGVPGVAGVVEGAGI
jgi:xanthine dehydrogenase accessory factor